MAAQSDWHRGLELKFISALNENHTTGMVEGGVAYLYGDGGFGALDAIGNADHQAVGVLGFAIQGVAQLQQAGAFLQQELPGVTFHQRVLQRSERVRIGCGYLGYRLPDGQIFRHGKDQRNVTKCRWAIVLVQHVHSDLPQGRERERERNKRKKG